MNQEVVVTPHNRQVYVDIIRDMLEKNSGLFSFTVRVNAGQITDYVLMEVDYDERRRNP